MNFLGPTPMSKRFLASLAICLAVATAAHAQYGGGGMGGGMGGGHGGGHRGGKRPPDADPAPSTAAADPAPRHETALSKVQIVGVIEAIDPAAGRVTISYDEVDALDWPAGTMPFVVSKPALLDGASVGEKVRFHIESQQITEMQPYAPRSGEDPAGRTD